MWYPLLSGLVGRSIYAIDIVGDPGLSVQRVPIRDEADLAEWLDEVLDALALDRINLVGASYGGWIASRTCGECRSVSRALILVEPVLDKLRGWFWIHGIVVRCRLRYASPDSSACPSTIAHEHRSPRRQARARRYGFLGLTRYRRGLPKPVRVTNAELAAVSAPTLLLLGAQSEIDKSPILIARARAAMPNVSAVLIDEAGHGLPVDKADEVARRIQSFLAANTRSHPKTENSPTSKSRSRTIAAYITAVRRSQDHAGSGNLARWLTPSIAPPRRVVSFARSTIRAHRQRVACCTRMNSYTPDTSTRWGAVGHIADGSSWNRSGTFRVSVNYATTRHLRLACSVAASHAC